MTYFTNWEEFSKAVERLYASNPTRCSEKRDADFMQLAARLPRLRKLPYGAPAPHVYVLLVTGKFVVKYEHKKGKMVLKMTDDVVCVQYGTDQLQDVKRLEKLTATLMRNIVAK